MSASIDFQGSYAYRFRYRAPGTTTGHPAAYSCLTIEDGQGSSVTLYFDGPDALDALAAAAAAARGQWPGDKPGPTAPDAADRTGHSASSSPEPGISDLAGAVLDAAALETLPPAQGGGQE